MDSDRRDPRAARCVRTTAVVAVAQAAAFVAALAVAGDAGASDDAGGATRALAERPPAKSTADGVRPAVDALAPADLDRLAAESRARWTASPHGEMLVRILPESLRPTQLPDARSRGAKLTALYCVQCHHLPNPAMHDAGRWRGVVERMLPRMEGKGNLGVLMAEMMKAPGGASARGLAAPSEAEAREIVAYLQRHALQPLDASEPVLAIALGSDAGVAFRRACDQCHALPDPRRHAAADWPAVVRRMEANMLWMNRVVGTRFDIREPQLRAAEITAFLQRHARR